MKNIQKYCKNIDTNILLSGNVDANTKSLPTLVSKIIFFTEDAFGFSQTNWYKLL